MQRYKIKRKKNRTLYAREREEEKDRIVSYLTQTEALRIYI